MSEFINTADIIGDDEMCDQIIMRTVTEYKENRISIVGQYAFNNCKALTEVDLPNVTIVESNAFFGCSSLTEINIPNVTKMDESAFQNCTALAKIDLPNITEIRQQAFRGCTSLIEANIPNVTTLYGSEFRDCHKLAKVNMPKLSAIPQSSFYQTGFKTVCFPLVTKIGEDAFWSCANLTLADLPSCVNIGLKAFFQSPKFVALILRSPTMCVLQNVNAFDAGWEGGWTGIKRGDGYVYVPRSLVDSYKTASNWSAYASQFRALEDYTVDGTITGRFKAGNVTHNVYCATIDGPTGFIMGSYTATVTTLGNSEFVEFSVVMDGIDITNSVYSNGTINIPEVIGDVVITAKANNPYAVVSVPLNGAESGDLPVYRLDVKAGQKLRLHYYLTKNSGYIYDGRGCGTGYDNSGHTVNAPATQDVTIASNGHIVFSGYFNDQSADGTLASNSNDRLSGRYLYVEILE